MCNSLRVFARFPHRHQIIRDALPAHTAVLLELLMQETQRLRPLHRSNRIFPYADFAVIDKSDLLKEFDQLPAEVPDPDVSVSLLARRQVHAVKAHQPSRFQHPEELLSDKPELLIEFLRRPAIAQISVTVAVYIQALKRRAVYDVVHGLLRQHLQHLRAVTVIQCIFLRDFLSFYPTFFIHCGTSIFSKA